MLVNPFILMSRLLICAFRIFGYFSVFLFEVLWYLKSGPRYRYKIGEAYGALGRGAVDAIADVFKKDK